MTEAEIKFKAGLTIGKESDKLFTPNNGKFIGLVQLLANFDPIMEGHVRLPVNGDLTDHFCCKNIQK